MQVGQGPGFELALGLTNTRVKSASSADAVSLFRSVLLLVLSRGPHLDFLRRCSDQNLGYTTTRKKKHQQMNIGCALFG